MVSRTWTFLCGIFLLFTSIMTYADGEVERSDELDSFIESYKDIPYQSFERSNDGSTLTFTFSDNINVQTIAQTYQGVYIPSSLRGAIDVAYDSHSLSMDFSQAYESDRPFNPYSPELGDWIKPRSGVYVPAWDTYPVGLLQHREEVVRALPDDIYTVIGTTTVPNFVFGDEYYLKIHSFVPGNPCAVQDCWVLQGRERASTPNFVVPD